jgi:hypothetical protein
MVRAAARGVIDYSQADPTDINWRIRHRLLLKEIQRQDDYTVFDAVHRHWLSYVAHGSLTEDSFKSVKEHADEALTHVQEVVFPWLAEPVEEKPKGQKDTIKPEHAELIERYKQRFGNPAVQKE